MPRWTAASTTPISHDLPSGARVDREREQGLEGLDPDKPEPKLNFIHVHYFPAGATQYATQAKVGYEYAGKTYVGRFDHVAGVNNCNGCHEAHSGELAVVKCTACHQNVRNAADLPKIRMSTHGDFDGNGREDGLGQEIATLKSELYAAIQRYAREVGGSAIAFTEAAHPYWHRDTNGNGRIDPDEVNPANKYPAYTPRLMQAIYNYTFVLRDPGAAYHNPRYTMQLLYDSLESLAARSEAGVNMQARCARKGGELLVHLTALLVADALLRQGWHRGGCWGR